MRGVSHGAPSVTGVNASPQGVPSPEAATGSEVRSALAEAPMSLQGVRCRASLWACVERDLRVCGLFPAGNDADASPRQECRAQEAPEASTLLQSLGRFT